MQFLWRPHAALWIVVRVHKVRKRMRLLVTFNQSCGSPPLRRDHCRAIYPHPSVGRAENPHAYLPLPCFESQVGRPFQAGCLLAHLALQRVCGFSFKFVLLRLLATLHDRPPE